MDVTVEAVSKHDRHMRKRRRRLVGVRIQSDRFVNNDRLRGGGQFDLSEILVSPAMKGAVIVAGAREDMLSAWRQRNDIFVGQVHAAVAAVDVSQLVALSSV